MTDDYENRIRAAKDDVPDGASRGGIRSGWLTLIAVAVMIFLAGLLVAPVNVIEGSADRNRDYLAAVVGTLLWAATVYGLATLVGVA